MAVKLDYILRANSFMQIERPPVLWEVATPSDDAFIRLLAEMMAFALQWAKDPAALTLNAANVEIPDSEAAGVPAGQYVAITLRGPGTAPDELQWRPDSPKTFGLFGDLDYAAANAQAIWIYTRKLNGAGSITALLRRGFP